MKKQAIIVMLVGIVLILILFGVFAWRGDKMIRPEVAVEPTLAISQTTAVPTEDTNMTVDVAHGFLLKFPTKYADVLVHQHEVYDSLITEVFSMRNGEKDISLFQISFGDETAGDWFGILSVDDKIIPVTHTVFALENEEYTAMDEKTQKLYSELMNSFSDILNTIAEDPRFTAEKPLAVGEDTQVKTTYLTLDLPSNMSVVETNEEDTYVAAFYGEVVGERIALYQVRIGDNKAESELGLFEVDGIKKPISVGSFDLAEKPNWTEDDYSAAYRMMDTINHVIGTIMNSEQFSLPTSEEQTQ